MPYFRLCWTEEVRVKKGESETSTDWVSTQNASPATQDTIQAMLNAGNEKFGNGSHWMEQWPGERPDAQ